MKDDYNPSRKRIDGAAAACFPAALVLVFLFAWLARAVAAGDTLGFDTTVREAIHAHAWAPLTGFLRGVTWGGSVAVLVPAGALLLYRWLRGGRRRAALLFFVIMAGAVLLDITLKDVFRRPRPQAFFGLTAPHTWSFPSGHALEGLCFYGTVAALARRRRPAVWAGAAALAGLVGFSRVYLGVHYPTDVLAGYAVGGAWALTVRAAAGWRRAAARVLP